MGYNTQYELNIIPNNHEIFEVFQEDSGFHEEEAVTWYDWRRDCISISLSNPGYLIVVTGKGEEAGDMWRRAFLNGSLVWEWVMDSDIPDVPDLILKQADAEFKVHQSAYVTERIQELEGEIKQLKRLVQ